jgi:hypothetical protein
MIQSKRIMVDAKLIQVNKIKDGAE